MEIFFLLSIIERFFVMKLNQRWQSEHEAV